ncbi:MAG: class I SAM-dependent methyltransferase [Actinobacteria bacterium]|nr:class I SAM-dependent methyltransferase [Actinomycetota bacterium]
MSAPQQDPTVSFWEHYYLRRPQAWSGRPNAVLLEEVSDLIPGSALDLGCGEGADALWLAGRGWHVTGVDVSRTALERAARAAEVAGLFEQIVWEWHDLALSFPGGTYDLVSAQFLQSPIDFPRDEILSRAAEAVAPGGTLLVVGHAAPPSWAGHPHVEGMFVDATETATAIGLHDDGWVLNAREVRERPAVGADGELGKMSDSVIKARRKD